jgi:16S rRNA processing protein RimM
MASTEVIVGKITGVYGIKGWVKIYSYTRPITGILQYKTWLLGQPGKPAKQQAVEVIEGRQQGKGIIAKLAGYDDRDQVRALIDQDIAIPRSELPALPEGQYYWSDLEGLTVIGMQGEILGQVDHLMETGANDVIVVTPVEKKLKSCLIPYVPEVVRAIDLEQGTMQVDWQLDWDAE